MQAFPYLVSPDAALSAKAKADGTSYTYVRDPYNTPAITAAASKASVCMVFISSDSGEEIDANDGNIGDRNNLTSWFNGDSLVKTVSSSCKNTGESSCLCLTFCVSISPLTFRCGCDVGRQS